jgi:hypothetical protein
MREMRFGIYDHEPEFGSIRIIPRAGEIGNMNGSYYGARRK